MVHLLNGILPDRIKKEVLPFATVLTDPERIMLIEIRQSEKDKYHPTHMWNLMSKINKQNRNRLLDTEYRLTAVREKGDWRAGEIGEGLRKKNS